MIYTTSSGSLARTRRFLESMKDDRIFSNLDSYGRQGVDRLAAATPIETGETAHSWEYVVTHSKGYHELAFYNTHVENGYVNVAIILQYGHGTGTGGWVEGIDYINPALRPLFDKIVEDLWRQVTNA